jgi:HK97 family phage portal protein
MSSLSFTVDALPGAAAPSVVMPMAVADPVGYDSSAWQVLCGPRSESGIRVTPSTALSHGPVWAAVNMLAGDTGQLPWHKMIRRGRTRDRDDAHALEYIIGTQPNDYQTPAMWKEWTIATALLWGNAISYVERERGLTGPVTGLYPLAPDRTGYIIEGNEYFVYSWINNQLFWFSPDELFHIRGLAVNGFWGRSFVDVCSDVVGHGLALRHHGNATFRNGARPSVAVKHPKTMSDAARAQFRKEWEARHAGVDNDGSVVILWEGMELSTYSLSNVDAQWLEAVKLDPVHIAMLTGVPPHMLGALENSAVRANLEEQTRSYFQRGLSRHLNKLCEEAKLKLLTDRERRSPDPAHYFKFITEAFLKGDVKTRFASYTLAIASRILNPNECREREDLNPYEGGDEFLNPAIDPAVVAAAAGDNGNQDNPDGEDPQVDALRNLVRSQCESLVQFEANKLAWAAKNPKNFVAWLDDFYGDTFLAAAGQRLAAVVELALVMGFPGISDESIAEHAEASKTAALAIAGACSQAELPEKIASLTEALNARTDVLARAILGETTDAR